MKRYLFLTVTLIMFFSLAVNAFAATRYVATNGNNRNPGTQAQPWRTLTYAESRLNTGDTVIVRGGRYTEWFIIDVPNVTFKNYPNESPIIDGGWVRPVAPNVPRSYDALLGVKAAGVTIDGFEVKNSTGTGLKVWGSGNNNVTIRNCKAHDTYYAALQLSHFIQDVLIEDCEFYNGAKVWYLHRNRAIWGDPANVTTPDIKRATFRRCIIRDSYNEGMNLERFSDSILVEYCQIYGNVKHQLYIVNSKNHTIRYNLIYGTNPNENGQSAIGNGVSFGNESQWKQTNLYANCKVYGNLIANNSNNFWITGTNDRKVHNVYAYNNTLVEATQYAVRLESNTGYGHIFKNNIIWQTGNIIAYAQPGQVTVDYNLWSRKPDSDIMGANDPAYAVPQLAKATGWNRLVGGSLRGSEFALQSTSPAIDAGTPLYAGFDNIPECNKSIWPTQIVLMRQDNQGSGWEIGADIHDVANPIVLDSPTGLTILSP